MDKMNAYANQAGQSLTPARTTHITNALSNLEHKISELEAATASICARVEPVCRLAEPVNEKMRGELAAPGPTTPIAANIEQQVARINGVIARLCGTMELIEI